MKALLTGGTGFVGPHVLDRLFARGVSDIRCLVRPGSNRAPIEAVLSRHRSKVELVEGALESAESAARALDGVTVVYHLAAALKGQPADMFANTVVTSKNLLEGALRHRRPARMILISSFSVYQVAELPSKTSIDEATPLESRPARRDLYAQCKLRQEQLFWEYHRERGVPLTVVRPGVIYGPRGSALSSRIGLSMPGIFLYFGGDNILPLSYVENCADAIVHVGQALPGNGETVNILDNDLRTCRQYFQQYQREVGALRSIPVPYPFLKAMSALIERYHSYSRGQLPAILTPYKVASTWKGMTFSNEKLKGLGWQPIVSTEEAIRRTFADLRSRETA